jgi:hypothetical protein
MPHPNDDFIKKFLNLDKGPSKAEQKLSYIKKFYDLKNAPKQKTLTEDKKQSILGALDKIFYRNVKNTDSVPEPVKPDIKLQEFYNGIAEKQATQRKQRLEEYLQRKYTPNTDTNFADSANDYINKQKLQEETSKTEWVTKKTPFGVFYYNITSKQWMNTFGKIVDDFNDFFDYADLDTLDGSPQPIVASKTSYFSDDGSYLALYDGAAGQVDLYSVSYTPSVSTTLENSITLGAIPFNGSPSQKCLVSNDGSYVLLSCPDVQSVYFFDAASDVLLQTITESQPGFGEVIAADKDFYGVVITSSQLNRDPTEFDVRATSWSASTKINYYKRNYKSFGTPKFKKVFSTNAHAQMRKSGIDAETLIANAQTGFPQPGYGGLNLESSQSTDAGVYRVSDLQVKGYNYSLASLGLADDQISYKAPFFNIDSTRYGFLSNPGFTYNPLLTSVSRQFSMLVNNQPNIDLGFDPLPTDAECESVFKLLTLPSVKQFSITRLVGGVEIDDKSYYSMASKAPVTWGDNVPVTFLENPSGLTYFNQNIVGSYSEKTYIRGLLQLRLSQENSTTTNNSNPVIDERVLNTKIGINDTHTYHVSQVLTSSTIKNIRIYRSLNTGTDGTKTYNFQDYGITGTTSGAIPVPDYQTVGMVKILYKTLDATDLENSFFNNATAPATTKSRVGPLATKPYLSNPSNCPEAEFALTVDSEILDDTLVSVFASNTLLFLNFTTQTVVFDIDSGEIYLPVKYRATISTLSNYRYTFNSEGSFFATQNQIYKFIAGTNSIELQYTI